jgi:hypothetical protein
MTINLTTMRIKGAYNGDNRARLPVYDSDSGSGNAVVTMDHAMRELYFTNDSITDDLTLVVSGDASLSLSFTLKPGEGIDERFPEFTKLTITAVGAWRWYVRSGRVE